MAHTASTLLAIEDTKLKQFPISFGPPLLANQIHFLAKGENLKITSYEKDDGTFEDPAHYKIKLVVPINGFTDWYAYIPHVQIS
jgi:hypothetical protein